MNDYAYAIAGLLIIIAMYASLRGMGAASNPIKEAFVDEEEKEIEHPGCVLGAGAVSILAILLILVVVVLVVAKN
ncbi:MAG: hypothetical protein ACXAB9_15740 [Candidatus Thorarchaeota archaeon]|jgi:hypothetical protein